MRGIDVMKKLGLVTEKQAQANETCQKLLRSILDDPARVATSLLILYLDPDRIAGSAPEDAPDTFEQETLLVIAAEIDRRFPIPT